VTFEGPTRIIQRVTFRRLLIAASIAALAGAACTRAAATTPSPRPPSPSPPAVPALADPPAPAPGSVLAKGTFVARPRAANLMIWRGPSTSAGHRWAFPARNAVGQRLEFLVARTARDGHGDPWLKLLLPIRPNGAAGWVKMADVSVRQVHQRIVIDLSARTLRYFRRGTLTDHFSVGIGRAETPTAVGTFYVWAQVPQASAWGPYGVFALGLSGFSPVLKDWPGGGRMAIHGTANAGDRGQMVSHGCVRVFNDDMVDLRHVPLGTPVIIKR
jgi:lipoprotein-anchoring transpeptidase ErfK/SrfK